MEAPAPNVAGVREMGAMCPCCRGTVRPGDLIQACGNCGTVHHQACWNVTASCASYDCAPDRRELDGSPAAMKITLDEVAALTVVAPRSQEIPKTAASRQSKRWSTAAIWSFVLALIGVPFFGICGLFAVGAGILALQGGRERKGRWMAAAGILLGIVDLIGWSTAFVILWSLKTENLTAVAFRLDPASLEGLDPIIGRSMRANVLIVDQGLLGGTIGSGVIMRIDAGEALIITNRHVVDPSFQSASPPESPEYRTGLDIHYVDQTRQVGRVVWIAPSGVDLALVRAPCPSPQTRACKWQPNKKPHIGEQVFAIGNPAGLGWTHTQGVISQLRVQDIGGLSLSVLQTQAVINKGNSGGGLYDKDGNLLGINTWTHDKRVSEGLSFAIALDALRVVKCPFVDLDDINEAAP